jgi:hypothetical protein
MQRQSGPDIQNAEDFAHDVQSVTGSAPPMPGIEGIAGSSTHNGEAISRGQFSPEETHAPGMGFGGHDNHGAVLFAGERGADHFDFVGGIHDRSLEHANRPRGHSFVNQDAGVVVVFAGEGNSHFSERCAGFRGMRQPDFRRVPQTIKFCCLHRPHGHAAAEHGNSPGFHQRVLDHQPAAHTKEDHNGQQQRAGNNGGSEAQFAGMLPRNA